MTALQTFAQAPYGAFELKRCYRKNMLTGTVVSASMPLLILLVFTLIGVLSQGEAIVGTAFDSDTTRIVVNLPPPINPNILQSQENIKIPVDLPNIGIIPNPVEAAQDMPVRVVASITDKALIVQSDNRGVATGIAGGVYGVGEIDTLIIPPPTTFVAYDDDPLLINNPIPDYPVMAQKAGLRGMF